MFVSYFSSIVEAKASTVLFMDKCLTSPTSVVAAILLPRLSLQNPFHIPLQMLDYHHHHRHHC